MRLDYTSGVPRRGLHATGGLILHVMNRGVRRLPLFESEGDYELFLAVLREARTKVGMRVLAYCVMPNHFHLVVWPKSDGQLPDFMHWLEGTHSKRWHRRRDSVGEGAIYQGRYQAVPVQNDSHFITVCRYVERNPLRANLVRRAQDWAWSSLAERCTNCHPTLQDEWPILPTENWVARVNHAETAAELQALRQAVTKGTAFGDGDWVDRISRLLDLPGSRPRGRPPGG